MRIVHINTKNHSGGAALVARTLHLEQRKIGIHSTLLSGRGDHDVQQHLVTLPQPQARLWANVLSYRLLQKEAPFNCRAWEALLNDLVASADVIHLHNAHGYYLPHEILIKLLSKPTVWTLHDNWLLSGRCSFSHDCLGYKEGCTSCPHKEFYPKTWNDQAAQGFKHKRALPLENCHLVTPSSTQKELFIDAGFSGSDIQVIANPTTLVSIVYSPEDKANHLQLLSLNPDRYTLLFAAEFIDDPRKGFDVVRKLLLLLRAPQDYQIIIVGQTSEPMDFPIKSYHAGLITSREKMAQLYAISDLTIIPSLEESFGLVGPEALSCGSRVVCNDIPVLRESMNNEAEYIPNNDPETYAKTIERESAKNSTPSNTHSFTATTAAQKYSALYEKILTER